jgi:hypothetical protein
MLFANFTPDASGQAALALVAGIIKVFQEGDVLDRNEVVGIFTEALRILPDSALPRDVEARQAVALLLREVMAE